MATRQRRAELLQLDPEHRAVSLRLKIQVLLGGTSSLGAFMFLGATALALVAFGFGDILSRHVSGVFAGTAHTEATIISWEDSDLEINERSVERVGLRYAVDGEVRTSYAEFIEGYAPRRADGKGLADVGDLVRIEYRVARPERVRLQGTPWSAVPLWALAVMALFPLIGLGLVIAGLKRGRRRIRLLTNGQLAWATFTHKEDTSDEDDDEPHFTYFFEYVGPGGSAHQVSVEQVDAERVQDEPREPVLYDPEDVSNGVLIDSMPGYVEVHHGGFDSAQGWRGLWVLIAPAAACVAMVYAVMP